MLTANQKRQIVRAAAIAALKQDGRTCKDITGKDVVSALTNTELRSLCAVLNVDPDAAIAKAETQVNMPGGIFFGTSDDEDDAPDAVEDAPVPALAANVRDRAWQTLSPLHPMASVMSQHLIDDLTDRLADVFARLDACQADLKEARETAPLAAITPAIEGETAAPSNMTFKASRVFGVKSPALEALSLPVWNSPDAPARDPFYLFDPTLLEDLALCVLQGSYAWLAGPKGTGKTSAAAQLAACLGRPFFRIAFNEHTEPRDLLGAIGLKDGETVFQDGALTKALRIPGAIVLFDEPTIARPGTLAALQTILDHRFVLLETGERVDVAQDVLFIAADNTAGRGDESGHYVGTRAMNVAFLDRFDVTLLVDYPRPDLEAQALVNRTGATKALADLVVSFAGKTRQKCASGDLTEGVGFRRLAAFTKRLVAGVDPKRALETAILNGAHGEDKAALSVIAAADLDVSRIVSILSGKTEDKSDDAPDATPIDYKDPRNARAARDFTAI